MHIFKDVHNPNPKLKLHYGDLTDEVESLNLLKKWNQTRRKSRPKSRENFFDEPVYTAQTVGISL